MNWILATGLQCLASILLFRVAKCFSIEGAGPSSALRAHRFRFDKSLYADPSGLFNPAGAFSPSHGWIVTFRWDKCGYGVCGVMKTDSMVIVAYLGHAIKNPDIENAEKYHEVWSFEKKGFNELLAANYAESGVIADLRPFLWKGEMYASGWLKAFGADVPQHHPCWRQFRLDPLPMTCEYTILTKFNFEARMIEPVYQFRFPIIGKTFRPEKNWAFLEKDGNLLILHSIFPCTTVFRLAPDFHSGALLSHAFCHTSPEKVYLGSGHVLRTSRLSGHLVPRVVKDTTEFLGMVHARSPKDGYLNWIVRLDGESLCPTHISAGPALKASSFHTEGYMAATLVVGSFHILEDSAGEEVLRILIGEGDQYSGWEDVRLADVVWHPLSPSDMVRVTDEEEIIRYSGEVGQPL